MIVAIVIKKPQETQHSVKIARNSSISQGHIQCLFQIYAKTYQEHDQYWR